MISRFIKSERAAVTVFVTIFLAFVGFGLTALVVDVGNMYVERKAMITAADSGALAGANVLREIAASGGNTLSGDSVSAAITEAKNYAVLNGADPASVVALVETRNVTLPNGKSDTRQVVDVKVKKNTATFFGRFLGDTAVDVAAQAIATWGYYYKAYIGDFLPIFIFDSDYHLDQQIILHDIMDENTTTAYGYIDVGAGMGNIKKVIEGGSVGGTIIEEGFLDGKTGLGNSLSVAVVNRMISANALASARERQEAMIGLVPVIDKAGFEAWLASQKKGVVGKAKWPATIKLPIKFFAFYQIEDILEGVKKGETTATGSVHALDESIGYKADGVSASYTVTASESSNIDHMVGHFTGEKIEAQALIEPGDQNKPDETAALWAKLIK